MVGADFSQMYRNIEGKLGNILIELKKLNELLAKNLENKNNK